MALSAGDRQLVASQLMRDNKQPLGAVTKAEILAAVAATDAWIDANTASFVAALPENVASGTTGPQKTWIFTYVLMRRIGNLRVEEEN
jgi:hypothetical protein